MDYFRKLREVSCIQKFSYGLGHVYNDLCAAVWFSYTLFYLQIVLQLESTTAGTLVMLGTFAVSLGFSLIFSVSVIGDYWWSLMWYGGLITLFQIGWATVQISHLSIIPSIARDHTHSADLTTIRYTASVCCGITVYLIAWIVLKNNENLNEIGPADFYKFREIALIITFIGLSSSLVFYCGTKPTTNHNYENISDTEVSGSEVKSSQQLFKTYVIYQVSLLYMASRLFTTLNLIYIPLYLEERHVNLNLSHEGIRQTIASVPLASFLASFVTAIYLNWNNHSFSKNITYLIGSILSLIGCLWIGLGIDAESGFQIYAVACLIGMGSSSTMISSLCLTADFAKDNGFRGGSVYSTVTFADKLICGGIVLVTQHIKCQPIDMCPDFYRHVLSYVCGAAAVSGLISLGLLHCNQNAF